MSDSVRQLASRAFSRRLAAAGILRPSMLRRSVSRLDSYESICGPSAMTASGFPNPYCLADALIFSIALGTLIGFSVYATINTGRGR
jgi:hypothetical protein